MKKEACESLDRAMISVNSLFFRSHLDQQLQVHVVRLGRRAVLGLVAPSGFEVDTLLEKSGWRREEEEKER